MNIFRTCRDYSLSLMGKEVELLLIRSIFLGNEDIENRNGVLLFNRGKKQSTNGKEFETYKVGTVSNSCSTMHKITSKEFTLDDFSHEHLDQYSLDTLNKVIEDLNINRNRYLECTDEAKKKDIWWQLIQLLPSSYNQKRTVKMSYEVLVNLNRFGRRKNHKLDEWREFCKFIDNLPYYKDITQED